jgi:hypothetical protein
LKYYPKIYLKGLKKTTKNLVKIVLLTAHSWSRDSSTCTATGYRQNGRGLILGRGKILLFSITSIPALGSTQPHIKWVLGGDFPGVKSAGV